MAELVTQISKIPAEVVKALKNEENKQLEEEKIIDQQQSQEEGSKKHESPYKEDMQVREREATKAKAPAKRKRKKSKVLMSPYITKYGSVSKDAGNFDKEEKLKYGFYGYIINQDFSNQLMTDYSQWIAIGLLKTHSAKKETDNHYRVNASKLGYPQLNFVVAQPQSKN
ncbi:hypothetical protein BC332_01703 [Capsicum chinense]|nr:hypothetical protein BC332_01703 [Capsicum chinense]